LCWEENALFRVKETMAKILDMRAYLFRSIHKALDEMDVVLDRMENNNKELEKQEECLENEEGDS